MVKKTLPYFLIACLAALASVSCATAPQAQAAAQPPAGGGMAPGAKMDQFIALRDQAFQAARNNRGDEQLDLANQCLALYPDAVDMLWQKFDAYRRLRSPAKAKAVLDTLLSPANALRTPVCDHYHEIGDFVGFDLNQPQAAIEWYSLQIARDPWFSGWTYRQRAEMEIKTGAYAAARADIALARQIAEIQKDDGLKRACSDGENAIRILEGTK